MRGMTDSDDRKGHEEATVPSPGRHRQTLNSFSTRSSTTSFWERKDTKAIVMLEVQWKGGQRNHRAENVGVLGGQRRGLWC